MGIRRAGEEKRKMLQTRKKRNPKRIFFVYGYRRKAADGEAERYDNEKRTEKR